jgi:hypothetical protein
VPPESLLDVQELYDTYFLSIDLDSSGVVIA